LVSTAGGTYYVRISGAAGTAYTLLVTRGITFDREPNHSTPQPLGPGLAVLAALAQETTSVEPDSAAAGASLTSLFPGLTLSVVNSSNAVTAQTSALASTGAR